MIQFRQNTATFKFKELATQISLNLRMTEVPSMVDHNRASNTAKLQHLRPKLFSTLFHAACTLTLSRTERATK